MGCSGSKDAGEEYAIARVGDDNLKVWPTVGPDVRNIKIIRCGLTEIPEQFCTSSAGTMLSLALGDNKITCLPANIGSLQALRSIHVGGNKLGALPASLWTLQITELGLSNCGLTEISPDIGNLTKLNIVYLNQNELTAVPDEICNCKELTGFGAASNKLTKLPEGVAGLPLQSLKFDYNQIEELPEDFGNLAATLKKLEIQGNQLKSLPASFADFPDECHISINDIACLPSPPHTVIKLGAKAIMAWFDERGGYGVKESPESEEPAAQ